MALAVWKSLGKGSKDLAYRIRDFHFLSQLRVKFAIDFSNDLMKLGLNQR